MIGYSCTRLLIPIQIGTASIANEEGELESIKEEIKEIIKVNVEAYNNKSGDAVPIDPLASRELDAVGGHLIEVFTILGLRLIPTRESYVYLLLTNLQYRRSLN